MSILIQDSLLIHLSLLSLRSSLAARWKGDSPVVYSKINAKGLKSSKARGKVLKAHLNGNPEDLTGLSFLVD
jgi:hypothetical protein